ncbi:MAG TPA: amidohydrolase family protein [Rudaea sp.]|nr:amidohydrolase family protein [Rudaea sp.]
MRHALYDAMSRPAATSARGRRHVGCRARALAAASFMLALALPQCMAAAEAAVPAKQAVAITDVTVVDVRQDRVSRPRTVIVDDGRITAIVTAQSDQVPDNALRVDGHGRFLIPGLVDMHVHFFNLFSHRPPNDWTFPLYVANGVTGVREMRGDAASMAQVVRWRKAVEAGELIAPRILAAGIAVDGKSPGDAARDVDAAAVAGADFIKVFSEVPESRWRAILEAARKRWLPVAGHAPAGLPLLAAADGGQRSNEHLMQAYEACSSIEARLLAERQGLEGEALNARRDAQEAQALAAFDRDICRRVSKALAATGQVQVPTLVLANEDVLQAGGPPSADPRWRYLRADEHTRWEQFLAGYTADDAALAKQRWPVARQIVLAMHQARVPIMAGTDAPMPGVYPGFSLHEEMAMLVESGLSPSDALRSATLAPAKFLGLAGAAGTVEVGMRADLVLLDADPTKDIRNTRRINAVLLDGRLLRRADLDALLEGAAEKGAGSH